MPKRKNVKNGGTEELVKELDPTEGKDKGAPDGKRATPSNRKQPDRKTARKRAEKEQAAAEEEEKEEAAAGGITEKGMEWEESEEEDFEPQSGLYLITGTDLKKGTATGVINGKRFTVNIKETGKELSVRLGRKLGEDEWKVWARCPVEEIDSVIEMAADLCKVAPQLGTDLSGVKEMLRYGSDVQSVEVTSGLLTAMNELLDPAALGAQGGAKEIKNRVAGLKELAALCKETETSEETSGVAEVSDRAGELAVIKEALMSGQTAGGLTVFTENLAAGAVRRAGDRSEDERNAVLVSVKEGGRTGKALVRKAAQIVQDLQGRSGNLTSTRKLLSGDTPSDKVGEVLSSALAMSSWESWNEGDYLRMEILLKKIDEETEVGLFGATKGMSAAVARLLLKLPHEDISSNREALNKIVVAQVARAVQAAAGGATESDTLDDVATEELKDFCAEVKSVRRLQQMLPAGAAKATGSRSAPPSGAAKPPRAFCTDYVSVFGCQQGKACPYPHLDKKDIDCPHKNQPGGCRYSGSAKGVNGKCAWKH